MPHRVPKTDSPFLTKLVYICPQCQGPVMVRPQETQQDVICPQCQACFPVTPAGKTAADTKATGF